MPPGRRARAPRRGRRRSRSTGPMLEIGSYCGKSADLPRRRRAAARHRAVLRRPPPRVRGEPARLGVARARSRRPRASARWTRCRSSAARSTTPDSKAPSSRSSATRRRSAAHWTTPLALLFIDGGHGTEPAHRDYELWTPARRARRPASASTTCSPTRPTAAGRRTRSTAAPSSRSGSRTSSATGSAARPAVSRGRGADSLGVEQRRQRPRRGRRTAPTPGEPPTSASAASTIDAAV